MNAIPRLQEVARRLVAGALVAVTFGACAPAPATSGADAAAGAGAALQLEMTRLDSVAAAVDRIFQPLPLLSFAAGNALALSTNAQHLARARALGIPRGSSAAQLQALEDEGRLVRLESGEYWVMRELDRSRALAVPGVNVVLREIGRRFHARLDELGAPRFRMEISSVLRTAADQEALRRVNPNAAQGESTHEFGTTFDILYSAYSAPETLPVAVSVPDHPWAEPLLQRHLQVALERVAGRRALELKAILGQVLLDMQREGRLLVTLERLQPVYHVTIARAR